MGSYEQDVKSYQEDSRECEAMRKMFVGGLSRTTKENVFFDYFGEFGEMVDKVIIADPNTKISRGFGFITYAESDSVEKVFNSRPHVIDGKTLDVKRAMPREFNTAGAHTKTKKLFIGGFKGTGLTPEELQTYIQSRHQAEFGSIESIDFLKAKESNEYKGFGFIMCSSTDFADRLAISESSFTLKGRSMSIKKAEPKEPLVGGGGAPMRGGRGGRGMGGGRGGSGRGGRGGGRGGYGSNNYDSYNSQDSYSTAYPQYGGNNQGYNQGQGGYGGYQQNNTQGSYGGYNQQGYGGGQSYGNNSYSQDNYSSYGQTSYGSTGGGRGGSRGGGANNRYQPY